MKPRFGSWGREVYLCRDEHELRARLERLRRRRWFRRQGVLVQSLVLAAAAAALLERAAVGDSLRRTSFDATLGTPFLRVG